MRSRFIALGLVWSCIASGAVAACGSDESSSSSGATPDASTADAMTTDGASQTPPNIVASDLTVYTGMTAILDASSTAAETFQWTVKSVPQGSNVTTQSLAGATAARPSFTADVSGDYVLELTARSGSVAATKEVTVKAVPAPLFFMQTNFVENPAYLEYRTVGTDGTGGHPVACRTNGEYDAGAGELMVMSMFLADMGEDWWEAPPGDPSRVAFAGADRNDAGTSSWYIGLGTNASTCQNAPVKVRPTPEDGGLSDGLNVMQPRFSKNGARVAYLENRPSGWYVATVGYDGNDRRDLSALCPSEANGCFNPAVFPPRPQWLDNQTVGWAREYSGDAGTGGWEIMVANDSANPQPRVYMTCDGRTPRSIHFLPDGSVIANREAEDAGREDLWVLRPSSPGGKCEVVRNLTNLPFPRAYARDFSISPDGQQVAFVRKADPEANTPKDGGGFNIDTRFGGEIYTVPVSGTAAPTPAGGTPQPALYGPRYVAGGSMLAWNGVIPDAGTDAGVANGGLPVIAVMPIDGGAVSYAAKASPDAGLSAVGGGNGGACDFRLDLGCAVGGRAATGSVVAMGAIAGALALRRRRRSS